MAHFSCFLKWLIIKLDLPKSGRPSWCLWDCKCYKVWYSPRGFRPWQSAFLLVLNFLPLGNNKKSTVTFAKDSFGKMAQSRQEKKNPRISRSREDSKMVPKYRWYDSWFLKSFPLWPVAKFGYVLLRVIARLDTSQSWKETKIFQDIITL